MRQLAESEFGAKGLSRQQRRAQVRKLIKNGQPRGDFKNQIQLQDSSVLAVELAKQYPMKPEYAEMMARYFLGRANEEEFMAALLGSLRDPRWMMKWFTSNHALSSSVADIVRKPGRELGENLRRLAALSNLETITAADVDKHCPGLSTTIRSLYSSVWENVAGGRKEEPSDSQPVDAMHAMYAPYVRVFRADRFMAPHIQKHVARHGTIVVPRLAHLVQVLKIEIGRAAGETIPAIE